MPVTDVLVERAAEGDVEYLQSATHGQHGDVAPDGGTDGGNLEFVEVLVDAVEDGTARPAVAFGRHVATAEQQHAVTCVDRFVHRPDVPRGGQEKRKRARPRERIGVEATPAHHRSAVTLGPGGVAGRDENEGTGHGSRR
jgi:hypothetical protein